MVLKWFKIYLLNRKQFTEISTNMVNDAFMKIKSSTNTIQAGVTTGVCVGSANVFIL